MEWAKDKQEKKWVKIENALSKTQLGIIIWNTPQYRTLNVNTHVLTLNALRIWDRLHKQIDKDYNSPLIELKENE